MFHDLDDSGKEKLAGRICELIKNCDNEQNVRKILAKNNLIQPISEYMFEMLCEAFSERFDEVEPGVYKFDEGLCRINIASKNDINFSFAAYGEDADNRKFGAIFPDLAQKQLHEFLEECGIKSSC